MSEKVKSIVEAATRLTEPFTHTVVGQVDDYCVYLSRFKGVYRFHQHARDEMYYVVDGDVYIDYLGSKSVHLRAGDTLVVRAYEVRCKYTNGLNSTGSSPSLNVTSHVKRTKDDHENTCCEICQRPLESQTNSETGGTEDCNERCGLNPKLIEGCYDNNSKQRNIS